MYGVQRALFAMYICLDFLGTSISSARFPWLDHGLQLNWVASSAPTRLFTHLGSMVGDVMDTSITQGQLAQTKIMAWGPASICLQHKVSRAEGLIPS
ncbi:hypothetical protein B0J15DRAFT_291597 [Fusarium solani]|uniref:Secreted protein n=1 Tax=Fusarium solani TaxID=169388 RepID=A0A9P9KM10_FUSSL|nr:uncharacterized protein B0J15DRAFT_291597 [Fusarium solani]KAH7258134.1 hypothetical protein B0J15DRAFT_291597 [Fusarium solani]